jgi:hypothetical protein
MPRGRGHIQSLLATPTKPAVELTKKLKPFLWQRILNTASSDTIWKIIPNTPVDQEEIELLFEAKKR